MKRPWSWKNYISKTHLAIAIVLALALNTYLVLDP